jgi:hypothetical protein
VLFCSWASTVLIADLMQSSWRRRPFASGASSCAAVLGLFAALTVIMTWPQTRLLATHAVDHQDVYFNMWRLAWVAHSLASSPSTLFDGNIFYPEPHALAFSDAMLVEGLVAAPLLWAGVRPVLVHNSLLLGAVIASALGMFVLVERLTRNRAAAVIAGVIFAFAPYRFDHYMHMELQWTVWMPWALWAVHRTIESGRWLHGVQAGIFVALQMLSTVYYGVFLATVLPLVAGLLLLSVTKSQALRAARALALGGAAAAIVCSLCALPYLAARRQVGQRSTDEIVKFSAVPRDYLSATPDSRIYGEVSVGGPERRLFPGTLAVLLAITGLFLRPPTPSTVVYLIGLVAVFEMSLGLHGYTYRFLYDHVPVFAGLRAPARLGIFVIMFLAVLAANGHAALHDAVPTAARRALAVLISCVLLLEYSVSPLQLVSYENAAPQVYEFLARLPSGVVAEFPVPLANAVPGPDARYTYMSTFHWKPLVNGYSGYHPPSYLRRLDHLQSFPDAVSIDVLRRTGVSYVLVHLSSYESADTLSSSELVNKLLLDLQRYPELVVLGRLRDGRGTAIVYRLE